MTLANFLCGAATGSGAFNSDGRIPIGYTHVFPVTGSFTVVVPGKYRLLAIGGGGGYVAGRKRQGGGGAGGLCIASRNLAAGDVISFTIGAGGSDASVAIPPGGFAYANNGGATTVTVGTLSMVAGGGQGGVQVRSTAPSGTYLGAVGGSATGGDFNYPGGRGGNVVYISAGTPQVYAGPGAVANPALVLPGNEGFRGGHGNPIGLGTIASITAPGADFVVGYNGVAYQYSSANNTRYYDLAGSMTLEAIRSSPAANQSHSIAYGEGLALFSTVPLASLSASNRIGSARVAGQAACWVIGKLPGFLNNYGAGGVHYPFGNTLAGGQGVFMLTYLGE